MEASSFNSSTGISTTVEETAPQSPPEQKKDQILKKKLRAIAALNLGKKDQNDELTKPASNWTVSNIAGRTIVHLLPFGTLVISLGSLAKDVSDIIVPELEQNCIVPWWNIGIGIGLVIFTGLWTITDFFHQRVESKNTKIAQDDYIKKVEEARFHQYLQTFLKYRKQKNKNYIEVMELLNNCSEKYRNALIPYEMWVSLIRYISEKGVLTKEDGKNESEVVPSSSETLQHWNSLTELLQDAYEYSHPSNKPPEIKFSKEPSSPFNGEQAEQPDEPDPYEEISDNENNYIPMASYNEEEIKEKLAKFAGTWSKIEEEVGNELRYMVYQGKYLACNGKLYNSQKKAEKAKKLKGDVCVININE